jgi:alkylation response protein AidB-like acyl-CoA dehydrogenase
VDRQRHLRRPHRRLARDVADQQVKGFVVEKETPGFTTEKIEDKIALRVVQNALITLDNVVVPEASRLQNAGSFRDTAEVLRLTRAGVAWMAVGCARGAYENALAYAAEREQFGRPIAGFQLVQDLLVRMRIAPQPGGGLTHASVSHDTLHGRVSVARRITDSRLRLGLFSCQLLIDDSKA